MAIVCQTESRVEHGWLKFSGLNMMEGGSWVTCHVEKVSYSVSAHPSEKSLFTYILVQYFALNMNLLFSGHMSVIFILAMCLSI